MVVLEMHQDNEPPTTQEEDASLREERKKNGRYVAGGTAIFLSLLGVYEGLVQGTPEYAALFAPVVVMFIYVLWILHTSRNQHARLKKLREAANAEPPAEDTNLAGVSVEAPPEKVDNEKQTNLLSTCCNESLQQIKVVESNEAKKEYNRSYSIA